MSAYTQGSGLLPIQGGGTTPLYSSPLYSTTGLLPIQSMDGKKIHLVSVNIVSVGVQNVSSAQLQIGNEVYSAPASSAGIGPGQGLAVFVSGSTITWMTADQQTFKNSSGHVLGATNGHSYCVTNSSSSPTILGVGTTSGPISNAQLIRPRESFTFTMNTAATPGNPIVISSGCGSPTSGNGGSSPSASHSSTTKKVVIWVSIALVILVVMGFAFFAYKRVG